MATTLNNDFVLFSTGQTIGASSSATMKNRLINSGMAIAQRGTSFTSPASGSYTLDRWFVTWTGAAPATVAQVAGPAGFRNALQITGATGNTATALAQRIESYNCSDLSGQTVTIQANMSASTPITVGWNLSYASTTDNFGTVTSIASGTWSVTTTSTVFSATITGLPAGVVNGLQLTISPNNNTAFTSGTFTITGTQLEVGTVASSFDYRDYGRELIMCQRYYQVYYATSWGFPVFTTYVPNGDTRGGFTFPVTMRTSPGVSFNTNSWVVIGSGDLAGVVNATLTIAVPGTSADGFAIVVNNPSALSSASNSVVTWGTNSGPTYYASAEL